MRPAWQVDTLSIQMKYLEAQKDHLSRLLDHIDSTIHDVKEWINGRINKTVSFTEMGTFIESTFSDVSTKCLEIYREHQYDPVVSEEDDEASDPQNLAGTASGKLYSKRNTDVKQCRRTGKGTITDDSRKENVVPKSRRAKKKKFNTTDDSTENFLTDLNNIKHKLDLFGKDLENVKSNEFENSHKLEGIFNTFSAYNKLLSDMQLKIDLLQTSQHETNAALKELSDFASPLKTDVEILSLELKSTDSKLHSFVDELKNDSENLKQKLSNSQDQFGLVCQLLSKKMIYMEQLRNILNTTKSFQDEPFKTTNTPSGGQSSTGVRSWSNVTGGIQQGGLVSHQSLLFQEVFPSLAQEEKSKETAQPIKKEEDIKDTQYGPGPSFRPQNVASWREGGGRAVPLPKQDEPTMNTQSLNLIETQSNGPQMSGGSGSGAGAEISSQPMPPRPSSSHGPPHGSMPMGRPMEKRPPQYRGKMPPYMFGRMPPGTYPPNYPGFPRPPYPHEAR